MKDKVPAIALGTLALVALGLSASSVLGTSSFSQLLRLPAPQTPNEVVVPSDYSEGCNQTATTTPCEEIEMLATKSSEVSTPLATERPKPYPDGPLVRTYTGAGFSVMYPDGYQVSSRDGSALLQDAKSVAQNYHKGFALWFTLTGGTSTETLETYQRPRSSTSTDGERVYVITPTQNIILTLSNGVTMLAQTYDERVFNASGNDITQKVCEECPVGARQYLVFKDGVHILTIAAGRYNDIDIERRIVQSVAI